MWNRIVSGEREKHSLSNQTPQVSSAGRGTFLSPSDGGVPTSAPLETAVLGAVLSSASRLWDWARTGLALGNPPPSEPPTWPPPQPGAAGRDPKGSG